MKTESPSGGFRQFATNKVKEAAINTGTPLYFYDLEILRTRIDELKSAFNNFNSELCFATMANDREVLLSEFARNNVGACVNSISHMEKSLACGFPSQSVHYTSSGINQTDMKKIIEADVQVNLDSINQIAQWSKLGGRKAGVRINAASILASFQDDRIGVEISRFNEMLESASQNDIVIEGLHLYMGTNFQHHNETYEILTKFFTHAHKFPDLEYLNLGGGIGVDYSKKGSTFDVFEYGRHISSLSESLNRSLRKKIRVIIEPGRGFVAGVGLYVTKITDLKKLNGKAYAVVDGSIANFPRPFHHPEVPHHIETLLVENNTPTNKEISTIVVGRTTFSRDILGIAKLPEDVSVGDILVAYDAGAYSESMSSKFLGQQDPKIIVIN